MGDKPVDVVAEVAVALGSHWHEHPENCIVDAKIAIEAMTTPRMRYRLVELVEPVIWGSSDPDPGAVTEKVVDVVMAWLKGEE